MTECEMRAKCHFWKQFGDGSYEMALDALRVVERKASGGAQNIPGYGSTDTISPSPTEAPGDTRAGSSGA